MRTKIILCITIVGIVIITLFNNELMPLRREISDMEIVIIAGLDKVGDEYMITFIKRNESSSPSQGDGEDTSGGSQVISMTADSYSVALRQLQTTTDKFTTASHIKYYIVGEQTLRDDFVHVTDAIARGYQTRLNSKIYMAKDMTAREFLQKASKLEFNIEEKLRNMENNFWGKSMSVDTDILDFGHISFSDTGEGLIDTLEFYSTANEQQKDNMESSIGGKEETKDEISFGYGGTAIISNCKIAGFLDKEQTTIANYLLNTNNVSALTVRDDDNFVVFRIENLNTDINFGFDKNGLMNEIKLNVTFKANYEETNATIPIFTTNMIEYFEQELNKKIKEEINTIISLEKEKGIDFLFLREKLELKHPYKYEKNKESFIELLQNSRITIESKGSIQTTYDVVESNKNQKGEGE